MSLTERSHTGSPKLLAAQSGPGNAEGNHPDESACTIRPPGSREHGFPTGIRHSSNALAEVRTLAIASIRRDGRTQHRLSTDPSIIEEYSELMRAGVVFPPVTVWWDGKDYWLSDGFQRIAAAERAGLKDLAAEVRQGGLEDALWDSYTANAVHGLRRSPAETKAVIRLALQHPNAANLSNMKIARHLHVPEATVRYWRKRLSSQSCEDGKRTVTRGGVTYSLSTKNIGKQTGTRQVTPRRDLSLELEAMRQKGSPAARRLLNIIGHWALGHSAPDECLVAIERVLKHSGLATTTAGQR